VKALCWQGKEKLGIESVNDPAIMNPRDAIVRITRSAICGSDLHLYDGYVPTMEPGDILGVATDVAAMGIDRSVYAGSVDLRGRTSSGLTGPDHPPDRWFRAGG
jgi:threonine dehydrogenase-like Zn-dependent dehydrogenase